jgi:hypothetical protein
MMRLAASTASTRQPSGGHNPDSLKAMLGELVQNSRGQWITQPPRRCPRVI